MSFGLDYITGPPIDALKKGGVTFVCRYLSEVNEQTESKLLTLAEAKMLSQANMSIVSNYEWYASRATEGHASGVYDAQIAAAQHTACGGPSDRPIYFSVDEDVDGSQCAEYFQGVALVIGLPRTGAYGSYRVLKYLFDQGLIKWGWQTYAWSYGAWEPRAHIQQYQNGVMLAGASVDYNRSMRDDFGQWRIGESMQTYTEQSPGFSGWFLAQDASHWQCKKTGKILQFGLKSLYQKLSLDGQALPLPGLPLTNEIYQIVKGKQVVFQVCERAILVYDPAHVFDSQPGLEDAYLAHLDNAEVLARIPGITLPAPTPSVDLSPVIASLRDAQVSANEVTVSIAAALKEVGISG